MKIRLIRNGFRVVLFWIGVKHTEDIDKNLECFRVVLFWIGVKLTAPYCQNQTCFRVVLFWIGVKPRLRI